MSQKVISFRDILRASWLQKYNEVELLSIERDEEVQRVLEQIGYDCDYPIEYFYAVHRDLKGLVAEGFMATGCVQINRAFITSRLATMEDILIASTMQDTSLTHEMAKLRGLARSYYHLNSLDDGENQQGRRTDLEVGDKSEFVVGWQNVEDKIRQMNALVETIRGPSLNEAGSAKTYEEFAQYNEQRKQGN